MYQKHQWVLYNEKPHIINTVGQEKYVILEPKTSVQHIVNKTEITTLTINHFETDETAVYIGEDADFHGQLVKIKDKVKGFYGTAYLIKYNDIYNWVPAFDLQTVDY